MMMIFTGAALVIAGLSRAFGQERQKQMTPVYVMAVGDSLTAHGGYCETLQMLLPVGSMVTCKGWVGEGAKAIGGKVSKQGFGAVDDVIVLAGVNDLASGRGVQYTVEQLDKIYQKARVGGARVIAVELTPWEGHVQGAKRAWETAEVNEWIAKSPSVEIVVDTSGLGPNGYLLPEYDSGDGLHLNAEGQQKLGELIFEQVYG
jgi:lysophospholipase L1-like esterase